MNYSIIIPHKNFPDLLTYCLSTIPIRDDVQVIVVDDFSDEDMVDFENFPQWGGKNYICVFTKEGKGAGYARNVGLKHVTGKWVVFADADDYFLPEINSLFDEYKDSPADVVFFKPTSVMQRDRKTFSERADRYVRFIDGYFKTHNTDNLRYEFGTPWCKLIRRDLIESNGLYFDELKYSNDILFTCSVGCLAKNIEVSDKVCYVITQSEHSLTYQFRKKPGELEIRALARLHVAQAFAKYNRPIQIYTLVLYMDLLDRQKITNMYMQYKDFLNSYGYSDTELFFRMKINNRIFNIKKRLIYYYRRIKRLFSF